MNAKSSRSRERAFTLLELLLSLALMAALFLALNQFVFSMGELWGHGAQRRLFERHASAVTRHVQGMLQEATSHSAGRSTVAMRGTLAETGDGRWLTWEMVAGDRILPWPEEPLPGVVCALEVQPSQGLLLRWHSRMEPGFGTAAARVLLLTPFGERLDYEYYDKTSARWSASEFTRRDDQGRWLVPDRLRLHFSRNELRTARTIYVPVGNNALPAF